MKLLYIQYLLRLAAFLLIGQMNYCSHQELAEKSCIESVGTLDCDIAIEENLCNRQEVEALNDSMSKSGLINFIIDKFPQYVEGFKILDPSNDESIKQLSLYRYLEQSIPEDYENDENFDVQDIYSTLEDRIINASKKPFIAALQRENQNFIHNLNIASIQNIGNLSPLHLVENLANDEDPIVQYVMKYKNDCMQNAIHLYLREWMVNALNDLGQSLLYRAISHQKLNVINLLIAAGADVNWQSKDGKTALIWAVMRENQEMVQRLITAGADVNWQSKDGATALFWAAMRNNQEMVQRLITAGANINLQNKDGETALVSAAMRNNQEMVQRLITAGADVNWQSKNGETALIWAAMRNNLEMVQQLIAAGADVNWQNKDGKTALIWAVIRNNQEMVQQLIAAGADINVQDQYHRTARDYAQTPAMRALLGLPQVAH